MKRWLTVTLVLAGMLLMGQALQGRMPAFHFGTTPSTFEPCTVPSFFFDTNATAGQRWMACEGTTFALQGDGSGAGGQLAVGAIYISVDSTNPATTLGYGTWTAFGTGRTLVALNSGDTDFDAVEETGGAKTVASAGSNAAEAAHTHSVTSNVSVNDHASHTHTYTQVVNHTHTVDIASSTTDGTWASFDSSTTAGTPRTHTTANPSGGVATGTTNGPGATMTHTANNPAVTSAAGSSHNHTFTGSATSVVQPYIVVYMWKRTA